MPTLQAEPRVVLSRSSHVRSFHDELDEYYATIKTYPELSLDEILVSIAGISGRVTEIRAFLVRSEDRASQAFRTREVEPLLEQLEFQFKIWSRLISLRNSEENMSRGGV